MKKLRFLSLLTAISILYFTPLNSMSASADTVPANSSTSTSLPAVMPAAHSSGPNSYLTITDSPKQTSSWPSCVYDQQTYCHEAISITDGSGVERAWKSVMGAPQPYSNCHGNGGNNSYDSQANNPPCDLLGVDWMEIQLTGSLTKNDLVNTYHWKVRTGKIEPDVLMLGDTQKTIVGGNANVGWTLEIWAKPAIKAYLDGCFSATTCPDTSIATSAPVSLAGYAKMLVVNQSGPTMSSVSSESLRAALRGAFISTNGMSQSWKFSADTFFVTAVSPHFLPPDTTGKSELTPGYVKVFLPEPYITLDRGYKDLSMVTPERVKLSVSGANATAKVTKVDGGILVDTGVEHFSAPNPEMMVLKATDAAAVTAVVTTPTVASPVVPVVARFKKGASKALSTIAKTKAAQKPKWSASGACKISGTKVVAAKKAGTCKVTLRVLNAKKKYVVQTTKTFTVS
ncbi:unannotated protein [freshwater metagenome]|uniref:Unannotated protein n=1 Tax=freshwater metagenome TaxID=449393 RepID=A0A6J6GMV0_9ZZZZ|nr:hypothetical protein [Actinomycetota bacterium]